jgi:hypothetical protein
MHCSRCGRDRWPAWRFRFAAAGQPPTWLCVWCALRYRPVVRRALLTSLVVGTALTAINQGDAIVAATLTPVLLWKIPLTYSVPYAVSTYSALAINRER